MTQLPEVSHSVISRFRAEQSGKAVDIKFLKPYFKIGSLVDALLTEPEKWNPETRMLHNKTRYGDEMLSYSEDEAALAKRLYDAFINDQYGGFFFRSGKKYPFKEPEFLFTHNGVSYAANLSGESDLAIPSSQLGSDIKVTACKTEREFHKKCVELDYDQQGAIYSAALKLEQFITIGLSRSSVDPITGLPSVFRFVMERGDKRYRAAEIKFSSGIYNYYNHLGVIETSRQLAWQMQKAA